MVVMRVAVREACIDWLFAVYQAMCSTPDSWAVIPSATPPCPVNLLILKMIKLRLKGSKELT